MLEEFFNDKYNFTLTSRYVNGYTMNVNKEQLLVNFNEKEIISLFNKKNKFWNIKES